MTRVGIANYLSADRTWPQTKEQSLTPVLSIRRLLLSNFRSYEKTAIDLDVTPVVLTGPNGAGKTNVLEAISFLSPGRGFRSGRLEEANRQVGDTVSPWAVSAKIDVSGVEHQLGTGLEAQPSGDLKRVVRINGETAPGPGTMADYMSLVWMTPAQDRMFVEGASQRRRFLDRLILGHDPAHNSRVNAFDKSMRDRQRLLEQPKSDPAWLDSLELAMAENGVAVAAARVDFVVRLQAELMAGHVDAELFPRADLVLDGPLENGLKSGSSALDVEDAFLASLKQCRAVDLAAGRATQGPNRTDLIATHSAKKIAAKNCSTGEQKAMLIGIVLANAKLRKRAGLQGAPILLLDEISAHLDPARRAALFDEICAMGAQAWMTGTEGALFKGFGARAQYFDVSPGRIEARTSAI